MPELTIFLDKELSEHLNREARKQSCSPEELVEELLRAGLPTPSAPLVSLVNPIVHLSVRELVALLESPMAERREHARDQLLAIGQMALSELEEALINSSTMVVLAVAELMAKSGSKGAIHPLLTVYAGADARLKAPLLHELRVLLGRYIMLPDGAWRAIRACTLRTAPLVSHQIKTTLSLPYGSKDRIDPLVFRTASTEAEIISLTALLRWQRTGEVARQAASALHQIALSAPTPQLRQALPFLHPAWHIRFAHPELTQAMKAIETATMVWKDLPLLAERDSRPDNQDLPLPVDNVP